MDEENKMIRFKLTSDIYEIFSLFRKHNLYVPTEVESKDAIKLDRVMSIGISYEGYMSMIVERTGNKFFKITEVNGHDAVMGIRLCYSDDISDAIIVYNTDEELIGIAGSRNTTNETIRYLLTYFNFVINDREAKEYNGKVVKIDNSFGISGDGDNYNTVSVSLVEADPTIDYEMFVTFEYDDNGILSSHTCKYDPDIGAVVFTRIYEEEETPEEPVNIEKMFEDINNAMSTLQAGIKSLSEEIDRRLKELNSPND